MIQEKQSLGQELERQRLQVLELQDQLDVLRNQTTQERKMRANVALKISENIAQERESLVKELDMLRSVNTKVSYLILSTYLVKKVFLLYYIIYLIIFARDIFNLL